MTSASGWLKMSSIDKNLRNSETGEVWARMNRTLTLGVGSGSLGSRRREQRLCVHLPECVPTAPPCSPPASLPTPKYNDGSIQPHPPQAPSRDTHSLPERRLWAARGWAAFHFHVPSIQQRVGMWWAPKNVCWVSEWVDSGWSRGEWGGATWTLMILKISQSLSCAGAVKTIEAVWVEGQGHAGLLQRDPLVALGWKGRPVPAHMLHATSLPSPEVGALSMLLNVSSVQLLSCVRLFATPWTAACQASLSITNSQSLSKLRVSDAIQPSHPLSSPSPPALNLSQHQGLFKWVSSSHQVAKVLELQLQHQSFNEHPGLISFRMKWLDLLAVQGTLKNLLQHHSC